MTKEGLIEALKNVNGDQEMGHMEADDLLIQYINDEDVEDAYEAIPKWFA